MSQSESVTALSRPAIGFIGGLGLLLFGLAALLAAASFAGLVPVRPARSVLEQNVQQTLASKPEHDFQLVQLGEFRRDQFLVDRKTGRVWHSVCSGKVSGADCDGMIIWEEMYVSEVTPKSSAVSFLYNLQLQEQLGASQVKQKKTKPSP